MKEIRQIKKKNMNYINAILIPGEIILNGEDSYIRSSRVEYNLPKGMVFSKTLSERGESIPIMLDEKIYGYAVTGYYVCYGEIYDDINKIPPEDYQGEQPIRYEQAIKKAAYQQKQLEEGWYGD